MSRESPRHKMVKLIPATMSMSPRLNTLANGTQLGTAKMSPRMSRRGGGRGGGGGGAAGERQGGSRQGHRGDKEQACASAGRTIALSCRGSDSASNRLNDGAGGPITGVSPPWEWGQPSVAQRGEVMN